MICESIITDRLHSHLHLRIEVANLCTMEDVVTRLSQKKMFSDAGKSPEISLHKPSSLFILIMAVGLDFHHHDQEQYKNLPSRLDRWRESRNKIAHTMTYTRPTHKTYDQAFDAFLALAKTCATDGKDLTAVVPTGTDWYDDAMRRQFRPLGFEASPPSMYCWCSP